MLALMGMHEIDDLLKASDTLLRELGNSDACSLDARWNLEELAERMGLDAGFWSHMPETADYKAEAPQLP